MRSPWSNDPERVQGALDTDMYNKAASVENQTMNPFWTNYIQSYYQQFPRPDKNSTDADLENATQLPNSSSDAFIENVIENDLEARNSQDKTLNRDLYYEDQLIHKEEKKRPRVNVTLYATTTRPNKNAATTLKLQSKNTTNPYQSYPYPSQAVNSTQYNYQYNTSAYTDGAGKQNAAAGRNSSTSYNATATKIPSTTSPASATMHQDNSASSQGNSSQSGYKPSSTVPADPYDKYAQYYKEFYSKVQNASSGGSGTQLNSSGSGKVAGGSKQSGTNASFDAYSSPDSAEESAESSKTSKQIHLAKLMQSASKDDVASQAATSYVADDDREDDDSDYLDQLDITALVRELIKLETIRKERQLLKRKHLRREQSNEVENLPAGDIMRGYFKNKKAAPQKGLKKHLLHSSRRLTKSRSNQSPLPKFNK